MFPSSKEDGFI
jgi:hypothetical protein